MEPDNLAYVVKTLVIDCAAAFKHSNNLALPCVEIICVPNDDIDEVARDARSLGAKFIAVHGETVAESAEPAASMASLGSDHFDGAPPGLITLEESQIAAKKAYSSKCLRVRGIGPQTDTLCVQ